MQGGKPHGLGQYSQPNGYSYEGEWVQGLKTGQGTERYPNGDTYVGNFLDGFRQGLGCYIAANVHVNPDALCHDLLILQCMHAAPETA